jgi:outer membrane protein TolC
LTSSGDDGIVVDMSTEDEAFRAFREASNAFDASVGTLRDTLNAIHAANHAQGDAIDALRSANQAALRLLRGSNGQA